jgi:cytochrome P450
MDEHRPVVLDPTGSDHVAEAAVLRARGPVTLVELPGGVRAWAVTSDGLLRRLLTDPRVSTDAYRHWPAWRDGEIGEDWPLGIWVSVRNMFTAHGAEHRRLRSLVASAFTARRTAALRPGIEGITAHLLDGLAALPAGAPVDLRERFAHPLPIEVICRLFGVPEGVRPALRTVVEGVFATAATPEEAAANGFRLYTLLAELVAQKRADPGDDLTSALITARDDDSGGDSGGGLTEAELVDTLLLMLGGGHETTVNLLDHAVTALLTHPDQLELVRAGTRSYSDVIEETLRWQAPLVYLPMRYAIEDIRITDTTLDPAVTNSGGGATAGNVATDDVVVIRQGDPILVSYWAAGRDPQRHGEDADSFDITRATAQHSSFGHGVHHCLGAPLARLEAEVALPALFARFPDLALADATVDLPSIRSLISNGHSVLPVLLHGNQLSD